MYSAFVKREPYWCCQRCGHVDDFTSPPRDANYKPLKCPICKPGWMQAIDWKPATLTKPKSQDV